MGNPKTKKIVVSGVLIALAIILKMIKVYHLPQGGSITLGSMFPILLAANLYGFRWGLLVGAACGIIEFILSPFMVSIVQVMLDYPLAYMMLALAAIFPNHKIIGAIVAISARFMCHFLSGIIFFANYAPAGVPAWKYSFLYNASWLGGDGLIAIILLMALPLNRIKSNLK